MPPLEGIRHAPIDNPALVRGGVEPVFPLPWPGYPFAGTLTPREAINHGHRFGIDTPYYATFTGFGEVIPLTTQDVEEGAWPVLEIEDPREAL